MYINVDNIEFQPWSFRRSSKSSLQDTFCLSPPDSEVVERAIALASDKYNIQQGVYSALEKADPVERVRFLNWLTYLVESSFLRSKLYNELLDTIIWATGEKLFLFSQTQYQFDTCKYYLDIIFKADINFIHIQKCREAFLCICILAERPDLQISSFTKGLPLLENVFDPKGVQFFDHLFHDNSRPLFFKEHFTDCCFDQLQLLIGLLEGKSPRKLLAPQFLISKKENALLHSFPLDLTSFHSEVVERYVVAVKLLKEEPEAILTLQSILEMSHKFEDDLEVFAADLPFWKNAFRLLARGGEQLNNFADVRSIVDYLEYQRYGREEGVGDYSLKGRTLYSLLCAVEVWHQDAIFSHSQNDLKQTWSPLGIPEYRRSNSNTIYRITEITSGKRLLEESRAMQHCVFSYLEMCRTGRTHIFSLTEEKYINGTLKINFKVTIQVTKRKLVQAYGNGNSLPPKELLTLISDWCYKNGIEKEF